MCTTRVAHKSCAATLFNSVDLLGHPFEWARARFGPPSVQVNKHKFAIIFRKAVNPKDAPGYLKVRSDAHNACVSISQPSSALDHPGKGEEIIGVLDYGSA